VIRSSAQLRATIQRLTLPLLVLLTAAIVIVGKADQTMFDSLRVSLTDDAAPVLDALSRPLDAATSGVDRLRGVVTMYQDNLRLQQENERLLQWQQAALKLSADNRELRLLLKAVPENAISYVTARVIASSGGGYVRSVIVNAGSMQGLARGQAAVSGEGLIGRLTEVGSRAARVLLITDLNSRIPVVLDGSRAKAVLAGDNSERPLLVFATDPDTIKIGDRIVTSGEGGVFPPGLPVGLVAAIDPGGVRIEPFAQLSQLGYVLVVDYGLSNSLPQPAPIAARPGRRGAPAAASQAGIH
jgi:rod shape-determining protein MreC